MDMKISCNKQAKRAIEIKEEEIKSLLNIINNYYKPVIKDLQEENKKLKDLLPTIYKLNNAYRK